MSPQLPPLTIAPAGSEPSRKHRIIDVHCGWGATSAAPEWRDINAIKKAMAARGIGTVFLSALLARRYDLVAGNEALPGAVAPPVDEDDVDVRGWMVIHPARLKEAIDQMRRLLHSPRFIGAALYADPRTGAPVTATDARELITAFRRFGKPLLVETPDLTAMEQVVRIADDLAGVKLIASGMGGDEWRESLALAARSANVFIDISGALTPEKVEYAIQALHGTRKILFGSGAPLTDPAAILGMLDDVDVSGEDRNRILYGNAEKLFNLGPAPVESATIAALESSPIVANYLIGNVDNPGEGA
ncbi:MAG: amidohydrolase family protein [Capsulimonadales bacterium]|nr:amidohydrolase family protein [Capsulimonadales bacterium]